MLTLEVTSSEAHVVMLEVISSEAHVVTLEVISSETHEVTFEVTSSETHVVTFEVTSLEAHEVTFEVKVSVIAFGMTLLDVNLSGDHMVVTTSETSETRMRVVHGKQPSSI